MMIQAVVVLLVLVAGVFATNLDSQWLAFKSTYSKLYSGDDEEQNRREIWESHVNFSESHNEAYNTGLVSYYLGQNEYSDMTNVEFDTAMNGYRMRTGTGSGQVHLNNDVTHIPDEVDWRTQGYVTPIKNQARCGSCWAFSATGSLEGQTFRKYRRLTSLSEQNLVDCSMTLGNHGCEGGLMDNAFKYIKDNGGIDTEISYPYEGRDGTCQFRSANIGANCTGFVDVKSQDESALQNAVATVGPISVAIDAGHLTFQLYKGGVYYNPSCSPTNLDHGVLVVGYGTLNGRPYWLVKNSWGTSWGINGYILMSRNENNNCGIATQASYPTV